MLSRTTYKSVGSLFLIPLAALVVNCREDQNGGPVAFIFEVGEPLQERPLHTTPGQIARSSTKMLWYAHEPWKDCASCHDTQKQAAAPGQMYYVTAEPELCYNCHADHRVAASYVHGPVAVGQCLFCHYPHKSRVKYLLKEPVPELCYLCHDMADVKSIPAHSTAEPSGCSDCHSAHSSSQRALLRES